MEILNRSIEINESGAPVVVYRVAAAADLPTGLPGERAVVGGTEYRNYDGTWAAFTGLIDATAGDAGAANIATGKIAYVDGNKITGTFSLAAATAGDATAADIIAGKVAWVDGLKVTGTYNFATRTAGTAVAGDIATGKTAWVNGVEITGTHS